jgi:hypothetical protein
MRLSERWRVQEAIELKDACMGDSADRGAFYHKCRHAFRYGSRDIDQARHNKIKPITRRVASFLYAPGRTYYWAELPPDELEHMDKVESCIDAVSEAWHDTGSDTLASNVVENSLVCGSSIVSVLPERMTNGDIALISRSIQPEMFGVFNPSVDDLLQQQAVCYDAFLSRPEIEIRLLMHSKKEREKILADLESTAPEYVETDRVFVSNYQGISQGNTETGIVMSRLGGQYSYNPNVRIPLYRLTNLFFFDDDIGDWNWMLLSSKDCIFDLPVGAVGIPGCLPVVKVQADPIDNYFWGYSLADDLMLLQDWFSKRMAQMDELFEKILKPPKAGYGIGQMRESKIAALNRPSGYASIPNPAARIDELKPQIPDAAFTMMEEMGNFFIEAADMRPSMFGKSEPGMRGQEAQNALMRITASPIAVKALRVEKCIEDWVNLIFRYKQRFDPTLYPCYEDDGNFHGKYFRLGEMPAHTKIKIDGHSSSPVFFEDQKRDAEQLFRAQAMDSETLIEFLNPPMKGLLKKRQKRRVMAQLVAQSIQQQKQEDKRHGNPEK